MVLVLQKRFGLRYNLAKVAPETAFTTADTFIHGALLGDGGTCASLPVVYVAVGRRLGYPLRLVSAKQHFFVRWEGPGGERFTVEANDTGVASPPDDHHLTGRCEVSPQTAQD